MVAVSVVALLFAYPCRNGCMPVIRTAVAHSPSHQDVRDSNPRTVSVTPYRPIDVGCWSYLRNLAALM